MSQAASQEPSSQSIADAALAFLFASSQPNAPLTPPAVPVLGQPTPPDHNKSGLKDAPQTPLSSIAAITPGSIQSIGPEEHNISNAGIQLQHTAAAPRVLPSLLRYVDHELMQNVAAHGHPPDPYATCCICTCQWDTPVNLTFSPEDTRATVSSTFLPLSPCGHWAHYRCLIWLSTRADARRNACPDCNTPLYHWEGITALTLAARTNIPMDSTPTSHFHLPAYNTCPPAVRITYESDCRMIIIVIEAQFKLHLQKPSKHADKSPDLVQCFWDAMQQLQRIGKPSCEWFEYNTQLGYWLWSMLVAIKMRRYFVEGHNKIMETEGWRAFEDGGRMLQERILEEVRGG